MTDIEIIKNIKHYIIKDNFLELYNFIIKYKNTKFNDKFLFEFLINPFLPDFSKFKRYKIFGISGSGGSGIKKPNISSITSLYLASLEKFYIIKIGSKGITSKYGSTDFFDLLKNKYKTYRHNNLYKNFYYFDIFEIFKLSKFFPILFINKFIKKCINRYIFHLIPYTWKLTGVLDKNIALEYLRKIQIPEIINLGIYGSKFNNKKIDEFVSGKTFFYYKNKFLFYDFFKKNLKYKNINNISKLNISLIEGNCDDEFWIESLRISTSFSLVFIGVVNNFEEGNDIFNKLYKDKIVKKYLEKLKC